MTPRAEIPGGCLCGKTRFVLSETPHDICNCHCIDCRRSSGAPFVTWGSVSQDCVTWRIGAPHEVHHAGRIRIFAACCGTPLLFKDRPDATEVDVSIASLDDPRPFSPQKNIWTEDKLPWVLLDPALPTFPQSSRQPE